MNARPYQLDFDAGCVGAFETSRSVLGVMPTGCGKTFSASKLAGNDRWANGNVLFLAHRVELLEQTKETYERVTGNRAYIEQAEREIPPLYASNGNLLIASVQTLTPKRLQKPTFRPDRFKLIIQDEAHHATAKTYLNIYEHFGIGQFVEDARGRKKYHSLPLGEGSDCRLLGITATPNRHDGKAMSIVFDTVGYQYEIWDAVQDGWLVAPTQKIVKVEGLDLTSIDKHGKDFSDADLEKLMIEEGPLHKLADSAMQECGERQAIVFTSGVTHAHLTAELLNRRRKESAVAIDGTTPADEREQAIRGFRTRQIQFLCNFGIATEGFDHPSAAAVVMGRPTKSLSLYVQMMGRGLRALAGIVDGPTDAFSRRQAIAASLKPDCIVLDYVGNSRHKLVTCVDALAGRYRTAVLDRARQIAEYKGGGSAEDNIEEAKAELVSEIVRQVRRQFMPRAVYETEHVSPFDHQQAGSAPRELTTMRGGATDGQVNFLIKLGVPHEQALRYGFRQAGAVINSLKAKRCTVGQARFLERHGLDPAAFNVASASQKIDQIKSGRAA